MVCSCAVDFICSRPNINAGFGMARFGEYFTNEFSSLAYEKDAKNTKKATKYVFMKKKFTKKKFYAEAGDKRSQILI
jgi:hypothetical protein